MLNRRSIITGLISFAAAPAIVRVESLMKLPKPVKALTDEEILACWNKILANSNWGKFVIVPNKMYFMKNDGNVKIIPDSEYYL